MEEFLAIVSDALALIAIGEAQIQDAFARLRLASRSPKSTGSMPRIEFARATTARAEGVHQPVKPRERSGF